MMEDIRDYKDYCDRVREEWEQGHVNELEESGWVVIARQDAIAIQYRRLTEEEFNLKIRNDG